ncbi:wax ester/triacylglycerol synthase family O-acyltransferase [Streptomyces sp. SL13]|uniref:Diacylglycerol O-acyltransferase n=1 Tax=Streptantibioticus silvisoli TaxID=2705255 RepID=A0AA90GX68_9ACTN|nr:wax ester/triacylglycerol synthase family O-acyltransferase [Streptantibioticus silvisoli]MDI5968061.1 wax ester/triacylglycerol synthase family O-acyltransferase [Streptantibioticus silvisoli]
MTRIRMSDRVFLALESAATPQHVGLLMTLAPPAGADPGPYARRLFERLVGAPVAAPFTYRLRPAGAGRFSRSWQVLADEDVDRSHHVRRHLLLAPGGERELLDHVALVHARPLEPGRPLWECEVIEGLAGGRLAFYFKVHHALTDGLGLQRSMRRMIGVDPLDEGTDAPWGAECGAGTPEPAGGEPTGAGGSAAGLGRAALTMLAGLRAAGDPARAVPFVVPRSPVNGAVGTTRSVVTRTYGLDRFRVTAKAAGVTVNDVLLSVCGGALRRSLLKLGRLPERSLTAGTPVSTRRPGDTTTANAFALTVMSLGTAVADPLERLRTVARSSAIAKRELGGLPQGSAGLYGALFTWPFVAQNLLGAGGATRPPYNVVVSNVPGPAVQEYVAGCRVEGLHPLGSVCHGVRLFVVARSGAGRFDLSFLGDGALPVPLDEVGDLVGDELRCLERAVGRTGAVCR